MIDESHEQGPKNLVLSHRLYKLLAIPGKTWVDVSMHFVLSLAKSKRGCPSIFLLGRFF